MSFATVLEKKFPDKKCRKQAAGRSLVKLVHKNHRDILIK